MKGEIIVAATITTFLAGAGFAAYNLKERDKYRDKNNIGPLNNDKKDKQYNSRVLEGIVFSLAIPPIVLVICLAIDSASSQSIDFPASAF